MADKTFGFKVTDEMFEKAKTVIDASGITSKEWFEKAVALYEINAIKQGSSDYTQDLTELEHHTTRMYELIANMIQRSVYLKDQAVKEIADKLESKESIITGLQQQSQQYKQEIAEKSEEVTTFEAQVKELEEKQQVNQTMLENNQALISEYKDKNDTLSGLVTKYQGYAEENEELKKAFAQEKADLLKQSDEVQQELISKNKELATAVQTSKEQLRELQLQHDQAAVNYKQEITLLIERNELQREKVLVEAERAHNKAIRQLYEEMDTLRKEHELSKEQLQNEIRMLQQQQNKDNNS